jgi:hypothetical protein
LEFEVIGFRDLRVSGVYGLTFRDLRVSGVHGLTFRDLGFRRQGKGFMV